MCIRSLSVDARLGEERKKRKKRKGKMEGGEGMSC